MLSRPCIAERGVAALALLALVAFAIPAAAQATGSDRGGIMERANLDRLQLVSLGGTAGRIRPSQLEPTEIYGVSADYGEIAPGWRVEFGVTFFDTRYKDEAVQTFADSLSNSIEDPFGSARVVPSPVALYDVTFGIGFSRFLRPGGEFSPTLTFGIAAHVINAEGRLIKGTFVERALDDIAAGVYTEIGIRRRFFRRIQVEALARGDLLSAYRSVQARAGASYYFGDPRRPRGRGED